MMALRDTSDSQTCDVAKSHNNPDSEALWDLRVKLAIVPY